MDTSELMKYMFEAPGDDAPDTGMNTDADPTPTEDPAPAADEAPADDDNPPEMGDEDNTGGEDDSPPDMGDEDFGDFGGDTDLDDTQSSSMKLDDKVSTILNMNLYQRFLTLLTDIGTKINSLKSNADVLYVVSDQTPETVKSFRLLDENIRLYLTNNFTSERYESNLLFFNKCLNLYKLLNDKFNDNISKGIKSIG